MFRLPMGRPSRPGLLIIENPCGAWLLGKLQRNAHHRAGAKTRELQLFQLRCVLVGTPGPQPALYLLSPTLGSIIMATQNPPRKGGFSPSVRRFDPTSASVEYFSHLLRTYFVNAKPAKQLQLIGPDGVAEDIPLEIYAVLREVFQHLKDGQAISLIPADTLLTTQQAAEILNISRPYLYRLLDADEIPFVRVGTHRKLRLADVEALRERRRTESRKALNAIASLNQECDDYGETTRE